MRIRTIKPEFFKDEELAALHPLTRLFFIGLWSAADKNGIIEDRPARLAIEILPYDMMGKQLGSNWEVPSIEDMLHGLTQGGWILRYTVEDKDLIAIRNWDKHQRINGKEAQGEGRYPLPDKDLWQKKERGSKGEAPEKQSRSQEQGTGNREQGTRNGYMPDAPAVEENPPEEKPKPVKAKKSTTQLGVYEPEFIELWDDMRRFNNANDTPSKCYPKWKQCINSKFTPSEIRKAAEMKWMIGNQGEIERGSKFLTHLTTFLNPVNVKDVLDNGVVVRESKSELQRTHERIYQMCGTDQETHERAMEILGGKF